MQTSDKRTFVIFRKLLDEYLSKASAGQEILTIE